MRVAIVRRALFIGLTLAAPLLLSGCDSKAKTESQPSPLKCAVALTVAPGTIDAAGGTGAVTVATNAECAWTATTSVNWITGLTPTSGQGAGEVSFRVTPNPDARMREGNLTLNDVQAGVRQNPAPCSYSVTPEAHEIPAAGGTAALTLTTPGGCAWSVASTASWITLVSNATGTDSTTVTIRAAANSGPPRSGTVTIADKTISVTQEGTVPGPPVPPTPPGPPAPTCAYLVDPASVTATVNGGNPALTVTTTAGCPWSAASQAQWIAVTSGATGTGPGTVGVSIAANTGPARSGTVLVAGQPIMVLQSGVCVATIAPTSRTVPSGGGPSTPIAVTANAGCPWTASSQASWLTITSATSGTGNGSVGFTVAPNPAAPRSGTLTIAGHLFTVTQDSNCVYAISETDRTVPPGGGPSSPNIAVTANPGCAWTASSDVGWLTITSGTSGSGNGSVAFTVAPNAGAPRLGRLTIAGHAFTVIQGNGCTYGLDSTSRNVGAGGGASSPIAVTANGGCLWTASSQASWITITSSPNGSGNGSVAFTVAANSGAPRTGTLLIAAQTFTVTQASGCTYAIDSSSRTVSASGGASTPAVAVSTNNGCDWTATSGAAWITITSPLNGTGSGSGSVSFSVSTNPGPQRIGTVDIAGQTFTVTQNGGCGYTLDSFSRTVGSAAGPSSPPINVTTADGCQWSATSQASWITVTSPQSGNATGSGSVSFSVQANPGPQRTGTMSIAGHTFTVTQNGGCNYSLDSTSRTVGPGGASTSPIVVTTSSGCPWSATSQASWITITSPQDGTVTGPGSVSFSVQANPGPQRTGTMSIAGQTFTVIQNGGCDYSLDSTSRTVGSGGGASTSPIVVTTSSGCPWSATSQASWITVTSPQDGTGTGPGSVSFSVQANPGPQRTGTMSIAGQTFTVTQNGGCNYSLDSTSRTVGSGGGASTPAIAVTTSSGCPWSATTATSWITITSPPDGNGTGPGSVSFSVQSNPGPQRSGTMSIAGQTFTVTQNGGCNYSLDSTSRTVGSGAGASTPAIAVTTASGCPWSATTSTSWITITSPSGTVTGAGSVSFSVQANSGGQRTGTMDIAGQTFTVTQQAACTYSLSHTSINRSQNSANNLTVQVSATPGCTWTAVSNASWIIIQEIDDGVGDGEVRYRVMANNGPPRTGTMTIAGITFTVNQDDDENQ